MLVFIAILVGANIVLSRYLNALYAQHNGLSMGTLANYATGLITSLIALLVMGEPSAITLPAQATFRTVVMFLGGLVGVVMVQTSIYITPRLPALMMTLLMIISQLGTGLLLDWLLTGVFSPGKLLGGALVLLGLWHYAWVGRRSQSGAPSRSPSSV